MNVQGTRAPKVSTTAPISNETQVAAPATETHAESIAGQPNPELRSAGQRATAAARHANDPSATQIAAWAHESCGDNMSRQGLTQSPESMAESVVADVNAGRLSPEDAISRADAEAAQIRQNGTRRDVERYYRHLAAGTAGDSRRVGPGGQSWQDGPLRGSSGSNNLQVGLSDAFGRRANRAGFEARMAETLCRDVDAENHDDVRDYMDQVARSEGVDGVQRELGDYMDNFYRHGGSVGYTADWRNGPNPDDIQNNGIYDGAGRRVIDCDGYSAIAERLTDGIDNGRIQGEWGYSIGPGGSHAMYAVRDTDTGRGFIVDNANTGTTFTNHDERQGFIDALNNNHAGQNIDQQLGIGNTLRQADANKSPLVTTTPSDGASGKIAWGKEANPRPNPFVKGWLKTLAA